MGGASFTGSGAGTTLFGNRRAQLRREHRARVAAWALGQHPRNGIMRPTSPHDRVRIIATANPTGMIKNPRPLDGRSLMGHRTGQPEPIARIEHGAYLRLV